MKSRWSTPLHTCCGWSTVGLSSGAGERCIGQYHTCVEEANAGTTSGGESKEGPGERVGRGGGEAEGGRCSGVEETAVAKKGGG